MCRGEDRHKGFLPTDQVPLPAYPQQFTADFWTLWLCTLPHDSTPTFLPMGQPLCLATCSSCHLTWSKSLDDRASASTLMTTPCLTCPSSGASGALPHNTHMPPHAEQVLARQGVNLNTYDHVVFDMPQLGCQWSGQATMPGSWVMMNGNCGKGVLIHELGHNYGMQHSNVLSGNSVIEYADYSCVMGAATDNGNDAKCYSLPWVHAIGAATPRNILPSQLPPGGSMVVDLGVVWRDKSNGIMIEGSAFGLSGPAVYYISLQVMMVIGNVYVSCSVDAASRWCTASPCR